MTFDTMDLQGFTRGAEIEVPETYEAGTWGPPGADALLERDGYRWRRP